WSRRRRSRMSRASSTPPMRREGPARSRAPAASRTRPSPARRARGSSVDRVGGNAGETAPGERPFGGRDAERERRELEEDAASHGLERGGERGRHFGRLRHRAGRLEDAGFERFSRSELLLEPLERFVEAAQSIDEA